ncbi:Kelch repeat-containing protein [Collimonas silvisoli]|uniref:kelch repeat-containing protein n=1 Tax=Collimonas silvisoli TaxID=2825884 RepID=UPI001B8BDA8C|nr:kelch repeat-containing protein [Collimonas silvisoli]
MAAGPAYPQPPVTAADKPVSIDSLSGESWRTTFAVPLATGERETLYFERNGAQARMWRLDWKHLSASPFVIDALPLTDKLRYTVVQSTTGIWFIGSTVLLLKADGTQVSASFDADEPTAVALKDGSVLVLGRNQHNHTEQMRRLTLTAQGIAVEDKGLLPHASSGLKVNYMARYGVAAITLADGRVLTAGGGSGPDSRRTALIEPLNGQVQPAADMPHKRTFATLLALPDGRILAAGGEHLRCTDHDVRTVDVYDPKRNTWQALPDLPFPLCTDAYYATGPASAVLADGTLVLGAHLEQHLLALRPAPQSATGYAAFWEVIGPTRRQRISGVLQAVSRTEVAFAGGLHRGQNDCCYGTPGAELVSLPAQPGRQPDFTSFGLPLQAPGAAQRGKHVFITAGHVFSFTGSGQMRYSSLAEILDLDTGQVQQLPALPFVSGSAQVVWLDDDRVLVKGQVEDNDRGFSPGSNLSSYMPGSAGSLAIYSLKNQRWSNPTAIPELRDAILLEGHDDEAILGSKDATLYRLRLSTMQMERLASSPGKHTGAGIRWLTGGRAVFAGGAMQQKRISLIDEDCESAADDPAAACPEHFAGWGPLLPATRYQRFTLSEQPGQSQWSLSAASANLAVDPETQDTHGEELQTIIDVDGRVTRLLLRPAANPASVGQNASPGLAIERSNGAGSAWQPLPIPDGAVEFNDRRDTQACPRGCRLLLAQDPRQPAKELLFLREGKLEDDWLSQDYLADGPAGGTKEHTRQLLRVWWLDEGTHQWREILQAEAGAMRSRPLALKAPLSGPGAQMQSLGWHLSHPVLWLSR